jgi:signal transduction histidine kinase
MGSGIPGPTLRFDPMVDVSETASAGGAGLPRRFSVAWLPAGLGAALATLAASAAALATLVLAVVLAGDARGLHGTAAALPVVVGVLYVASGLLGWTRRPHNRVGPLLAAAGLAWMVWALRVADAPFLTAVGLLCEPLPFAITLHLLLAFPSGRLEGRAEVAVAAAAYVSIPLVHAPAELVGASRHDGIRVLDVVDDASLADVALTVQTAVDAVLVAAAAVLVLRRLRAPDPRRTAAPVYLGGLVALAVVALLDVLDGAGLTVSGGLPGDMLDTVGIAIVALLPLGFVAGILRGDFARAGELEGLVDRLANAPPGPAALGAAVADALGDPSATLAYWLPAEGRYVDAGGAALEPGPGRAVEEVTHEGRRVGAIVYDGSLLRDLGPVRSAARVVGLALERERLAAELRASARELRASRARLAEVADEERRRIARDLHDGAQQRLVLLAIESDRLRQRADDPEAVRRGALALRKGLDDALTDIRWLVQGIVPPLLAERGLRAAAEELVAQAPIPVAFEADAAEPEAPPHVQTAGYFVISEALANVAKHAHASRATVSLASDNGQLRIEVVDDGVGGADRARGTGIHGMADRVEAVGGTLELESAPGAGTRLRVELPCEG